MHVYLWTMLVLQVLASIGLAIKASKFGGGSIWFSLVPNIVVLTWTAVLLWN